MVENRLIANGKDSFYHCWQPGPDDEDGCPTTCVLAYKHEGPHVWTRDDQISISFAPAT